MRNLLVALMLLLTSLNSVWAHDLEIIQLKHRSAAEVMPIIRPLLDVDGSVSGMDYQLILRTSPRNLEQIKQVLDSIDTSPRRLRISVIQDVDRETLARMAELSGSVGIGNTGRISVPSTANQSGLNVQVQQGNDRLNARIDSSEGRKQDHKTQQVQVIEGGLAFVRVGQSVAVPQRQVTQRPWGTEVVEQTQFQEVSSGFYVRPRLRGDSVTLQIDTQNDSISSMQGNYPQAEVQHATTTLSGRLGEWMEMGGLSQQQETTGGTLLGRSSSQSSEQRNIFIKVEEIVQ